MHVGTCIQIFARDTCGMYTRACSLSLVAVRAAVELLKSISHTLRSTMANTSAAGASTDAGMPDAHAGAHSTNMAAEPGTAPGSRPATASPRMVHRGGGRSPTPLRVVRVGRSPKRSVPGSQTVGLQIAVADAPPEMHTAKRPTERREASSPPVPTRETTLGELTHATNTWRPRRHTTDSG